MDQTVLFQKEKTGTDILKNTRNQLYRLFPFLDGAFASVSYVPSAETDTIGTDGECFYFAPDFLLSTYMDCPAAIRRGYLHMLLHCLYLHVLPETHRDTALWNLACDMAVEGIIEREHCPELAIPNCSLQNQIFPESGEHALSAEQFYNLLKDGYFSYSTEELQAAFSFDDHHFWQKNQDSERSAGLRQKWDKIRSHASQNHHGQSRNAGTSKGTAEEEISELSKSRYNYRRFLKQFALPREEAILDMETFDYIPYTYGMELYGDLPFVEPLEYKEGNRLEELVIAIDTSGSCSVEMVQQFLGETYAILEEKENFFRKMKVYILQCDCCIQDVALIRSEEDWKDYCKRVKIHGRAGTDFRPVFRYIEKLQAERELKNLKALIYFTDGDGIFPSAKPNYETAFVFLEKTKVMDYIPSWAIRLITDSPVRKEIFL